MVSPYLTILGVPANFRKQERPLNCAQSLTCYIAGEKPQSCLALASTPSWHVIRRVCRLRDASFGCCISTSTTMLSISHCLCPSAVESLGISASVPAEHNVKG